MLCSRWPMRFALGRVGRVEAAQLGGTSQAAQCSTSGGRKISRSDVTQNLIPNERPTTTRRRRNATWPPLATCPALFVQSSQFQSTLWDFACFWNSLLVLRGCLFSPRPVRLRTLIDGLRSGLGASLCASGLQDNCLAVEVVAFGGA